MAHSASTVSVKFAPEELRLLKRLTNAIEKHNEQQRVGVNIVNHVGAKTTESIDNVDTAIKILTGYIGRDAACAAVQKLLDQGIIKTTNETEE